MKSKPFRFAVALLPALSAQAWAFQAAPSGGTLFEDRERGIEVRYALTPANVEFSADLPAGWTFAVQIDGDRNGIWGNGPGRGTPTSFTSGDLVFGQDSRNGVFCAQYVLTAAPENPAEIYATSECNGYPSHGRVEMTQLDRRLRATITYRIPSAEVFGTQAEARLRVCVWDGRQWACQHSLASPFVLRNPDRP
jgi:hypothetical protein